MKNLKIKFGLFNLLAILAVSVFLTSCQQEDILLEKQTDNIEQITQQENTQSILLSRDIANGGEEAIKTYLENVSKEKLTQHINDYIIMNFLRENNKLNEFSDDFLDAGAFQDIDLSKHLSVEQLNELNTQLVTFNPEELSYRGWHCFYTYIHIGGGFYIEIRKCVWVV